jgi:hypothetical protein
MWITYGLPTIREYRTVARIKIEYGSFYGMCVMVPNRLAGTCEAVAGYNRANLCLSLQAHILALMKLPRH